MFHRPARRKSPVGELFGGHKGRPKSFGGDPLPSRAADACLVGRQHPDGIHLQIPPVSAGPRRGDGNRGQVAYRRRDGVQGGRDCFRGADRGAPTQRQPVHQKCHCVPIRVSSPRASRSAAIGDRTPAGGDGECRGRDEDDRQRVVADDIHLDDELQHRDDAPATGPADADSESQPARPSPIKVPTVRSHCAHGAGQSKPW